MSSSKRKNKEDEEEEEEFVPLVSSVLEKLIKVIKILLIRGIFIKYLLCSMTVVDCIISFNPWNNPMSFISI